VEVDFPVRFELAPLLDKSRNLVALKTLRTINALSVKMKKKIADGMVYRLVVYMQGLKNELSTSKSRAKMSAMKERPVEDHSSL